jgi:transcriptional regulator with XRE-family HTH domain
MLGENLKSAVSRSKLTHQEFSDLMGISKGNLYNLFRKDTFEVKYVRKASEILGIPMSTILGHESNIESHELNQPNNFGEQVIAQMSKNIDEIREYFELELQLKNRQLEAKDRQIEKLLDLLGKLEGAILEPLSRFTGDNDSAFPGYLLTTLKNNVFPELRRAIFLS